MGGKDDSTSVLINESKIQNQLKFIVFSKRNPCYVASLAIQFLVILTLCLFIIVREEFFRLQLTQNGTTSTTPLPSAVTDSRSNAEPINSVCFPCAEIGQNITNRDIGNMIRLDKKTNMCCMEDVGNLKKLFLMIINEYYRQVMYGSTVESKEKLSEAIGAVAGYVGGSDRASEAASTTKTLTFWKQREDAAHMFLDNKVLKSSNETAPRIPWDGHDFHNLSMANHLVIYHPDKRSIQVTDTGLYFVYSSVTFKAPATNLNAQVYHTLLREHYLLPKTGSTIMLMNKYGGGKQSSGFYTSFLCGAFRLRGGDELFVTVSDVSFLYNFYYSNYLGLYRL